MAILNIAMFLVSWLVQKSNMMLKMLQIAKDTIKKCSFGIMMDSSIMWYRVKTTFIR